MKNLICKNCGSGDLSVDGNITVCNSCGARFDNNEEGKAQTNSGVSQKICPFCGSRLNADELFCSNCGAKYIEFNRETETDNSAGQDRRQQNTPNYSSGAVNQIYDEALIKHKYSLIKFRRNLAIFMIISTIGAIDNRICRYSSYCKGFYHSRKLCRQYVGYSVGWRKYNS